MTCSQEQLLSMMKQLKKSPNSLFISTCSEMEKTDTDLLDEIKSIFSKENQ